MKVSGNAVVQASVDQVWEAMLDPAVLARTLPGCESLSLVGENHYAIQLSLGVGSITGTYAGECRLSDLERPQRLRLHIECAGGPGSVSGDVAVQLVAVDGGTTRVEFDAEATVTGVIGGVGQRMLGAVARRTAAQFFGARERDILTPAGGAAAADATAPAPAVQTAGTPAPAVTVAGGAITAGAARGQVGVEGVLLGAALTLLGVVGALAARRRSG